MEDIFISQITDFIEKNGGRYIIAEDGKPEFVIMNVKEYQKLLDRINDKKEENHPEENKNNKKETDIEKVNQEIALLRDEKTLKSEPIPPEMLRNKEKERYFFTEKDLEAFKNVKEEIKEPEIEDLPF